MVEASCESKNRGMILVVDDEELIRVTTSITLEHLGYEVLLAENGQEGVDIYREKKDDITMVIMDMIMPEMDGTDAFFAIREMDPEARVVIASGFAKGARMTDLFSHGLKGFLQKPFRRNELVKIIEETVQ